MKTPPNQKASESAAAKRADFNPTSDLFPDSLLPVAPAPSTPPIVSGQSAQVLELIRQHQPALSFVLTADYAIPETAARVHNLRAKGFNIITTIVPEIAFRGLIRRNAALYSLGVPEWSASMVGC